MRLDVDPDHPIWKAWLNGKVLAGPDMKPHSRLTVEPGWTLRTTSVAGSRSSSKLPIRYFQRADNDQTEIEIPGLRDLQVDYDVDADVATLKASLVNNILDPDYGSAAWGDPNGDFGQPGALTPERGTADNPWGYVPNEWEGLLTRNALIRSFEGYGGHGKMINVDEPVATPTGWTTMGALVAGDVIFGEHGQSITVAVAHPIEPAPVSYRLTFDDGSVVDACADHLWLTYDSAERGRLKRHTPEWRAKRRSTRKSQATGKRSARFAEALAERNAARVRAVAPAEVGTVRSTKDIAGTLLNGRGEVNHAIPTADPLVLPERSLPLDPYVLGVWLGDGHTNSGSLTVGVGDESTLDEVRAAGYEVYRVPSKKIEYRVTGLTTKLRELGLQGNKHVPDAYLRASTSQRLALLQGLMDTDGWAAADGTVGFCNTNRAIIEAARELVVSLGVKVAIRGGKPGRLNGKSHKPTWRLQWSADLPMFRLERKLNRQSRNHNVKCRFRYIVSCEEIEPVAMRCITVDNPSGLYLVGRNLIPTHNTLAQCIEDGNLVQTGVWLVDDTPIQTGQVFELDARNMGKLLVDQQLFPPLVPAGDYPMSRARFYYVDVDTPQVIYGVHADNPLFRVLAMEGDATGDGYWLCGTDGGVFAYGLAPFEGSIDSLGITIAPGTYPSEGITGMARTASGKGYWLTKDNGAVYSFGDAEFHGSIDLGDAPAHPIVAIVRAGELDGYWLVGDDGGVFAFGDAGFYGSLPPLVAGAKIVDITSHPDGLGYAMADDQGHVYTYGSFAYQGGLATPPIGGPVVAIASSHTGDGYYLAGNDGGVFAFGDAVYRGSVPDLSPPITLSDPISDIVVDPAGTGYWLAGEDGGVITFGVPFLGSMPGAFNFEYATDGNYFDLTDIVKDLALYGGFHLYDGGVTDNVFGTIESTGIYTPDDGGNILDATFFDKLPVIDPMTKLKEVVGYLLMVDEEGALVFREPNFWGSGNWLPDHTHVATIPVVDEKVHLTKYGVSKPDRDLRSEIIISSEDPDAEIGGTVTTRFTPATAAELRGLIRPAMWVNEVFIDSATQQIMAELIALQVYFKTRLGSVTCMANPLINVDDQVQILERETFEQNYHYVRRTSRQHDHKTGEYTMTLTTNVLSPPDGPWAVVKPDGSPSGSIVTNRVV